MAKEKYGYYTGTELAKLKQTHCSKCKEELKLGSRVTFVQKWIKKHNKTTFVYHRECWEKVLQ